MFGSSYGVFLIRVHVNSNDCLPLDTNSEFVYMLFALMFVVYVFAKPPSSKDTPALSNDMFVWCPVSQSH
jgi:hypothetical protein